MLVIYKKPTKKDVKQDVKALKKGVRKFFEDNPKRKVCRAEVWFGKVLAVKKDNIDAAIDKAAAAVETID